MKQGESVAEKEETTAIDNKPLFWTIYGIYCMIPVTIYAWYLWKRAREVFIEKCIRQSSALLPIDIINIAISI